VKGNVIDPLDLVHGATFTEVVHKTLPGAPEAEALTKFKKAYPSAAQMGSGFPPFGADALRFTLATFPPSNKRIALALKRIEGYRHFINKIWNATRFSLDQLKDFSYLEIKDPDALFNRWILSRLANAAKIANDGIESFRIDEAANELYRFFWNDVCDWFLELTKAVTAERPANEVDETKATLAYVLEASLRLLHPMMPFVTEELWQRVPKPGTRKASIAFGPYPTEASGRRDAGAERDMEIIKGVTSAARTIRSEHEVHPGAQVPLALHTENTELQSLLARHEFAIRPLVKTAGHVKIGPRGARPPGSVVSVVPTDAGPIEVIVGLKGLVTKERELERIERELKRIDKDLAAIEKKLASKGFIDRAPKEVVDEALAQQAQLKEARERLEESRALADEL
jgi:valyl-tRNA synthetase